MDLLNDFSKKSLELLLAFLTSTQLSCFWLSETQEEIYEKKIREHQNKREVADYKGILRTYSVAKSEVFPSSARVQNPYSDIVFTINETEKNIYFRYVDVDSMYIDVVRDKYNRITRTLKHDNYTSYERLKEDLIYNGPARNGLVRILKYSSDIYFDQTEAPIENGKARFRARLDIGIKGARVAFLRKVPRTRPEIDEVAYQYQTRMAVWFLMEIPEPYISSLDLENLIIIERSRRNRITPSERDGHLQKYKFNKVFYEAELTSK